MHFINKTVSGEVDETFIWKKSPTKAKFQFYERGIPVRLDNLFSYKQILTFRKNYFIS